MNAAGIQRGALQQHAKNGMNFGGPNAASSATVTVGANAASGISSSRSNVVLNAASNGSMYELNTPSMLMSNNGTVSIQGNPAQSQFMRIADSINVDSRFMRKAMLNVEKTKSSAK